MIIYRVLLTLRTEPMDNPTPTPHTYRGRATPWSYIYNLSSTTILINTFPLYLRRMISVIFETEF